MNKGGKFSHDDDDEDEEGANWQDSYSDLVTDLLAIFVVLFAFAMMEQAYSNASKSATNDAAVVMEQQGSSPLIGNDGVLDGVDSLFPEQNSFISGDEQAQGESGQERQANGDQGENSGQNADASQGADADQNADANQSASAQGANANNQGANGSQNANQGINGNQNANAQGANANNQGKNENVEDFLDSTNLYVGSSEYEDQISVSKQGSNEGHTDNIPINSLEFESNWELSTFRAVNVVKWLLKNSTLSEELFSAVGYGEYHPISDNNSSEGRARNRRVDFIIELKDDGTQ